MSAPSEPVIRVVAGDADIERLVSIVNATSPDDPTSVDDVHWSDRTYPGGTRYLAEVDGRAVGAATTGRIYMYPADHPGFWGSIAVLPQARRRGIGERLLRAISETAHAAGKTELHINCAEDRPDGIEFLAHRGFAELERSKSARLDLGGLAAPVVEPVPGIELTTVAARPDLVAGVHAVALETFEDIPGGEDPMAAGDLAEFRARDVDRPSIPKDAFFVAVDPADGRVVGYASLFMVPGSTTTAWHDMTAVLRAYRGRGIARALKAATIAWAIEHGLTALETGNDEGNAAMRSLNEGLGYRPLPDAITMRGPLFGGMMTR